MTETAPALSAESPEAVEFHEASETLPEPALGDDPGVDDNAAPEAAGTSETGTCETGMFETPAKETEDREEESPAPSADEPRETLEPWVGLRALLEQHGDHLGELRRVFDDRLTFDQHKEKQIDLLHRELQEHKRGLLAKAQRPLLSGMVRIHDSLGRVAEALTADGEEPLAPARVQEILAGFRDDVEILLEEQGVQVFRVADPVFDPHRQTVSQGVPTDDASQAGRIARRVRPGFEQDGTVLQKERVEVFQRT